MIYFATTQQTANWLLSHNGSLSAIAESLVQLDASDALYKSVLSVGPLRVSASTKSSLMLLWNVEYLDASGGEKWGIIRLAHPFGLLAQDDISASIVFERCLNVINHRLQGLLLPDLYIHRHIEKSFHTCLAGRGAEARQESIAYSDGEVQVGESRRGVVFCVGPWKGSMKSPSDNAKQLVSYLAADTENLPEIIDEADKLITLAIQRPPLEPAPFELLREVFSARQRITNREGPVFQVPTLTQQIEGGAAFESEVLSYDDWLEPASPLTDEQRQILASDILLSQPIRIIGPAGSGKTLLMQLLTVRMLKRARELGEGCRVLYIVHNSAMSDAVYGRFINLGADEFLECTTKQELHVQTLFEFSRSEMKGEDIPVIDPDAQETKRFQAEIVQSALEQTLIEKARSIQECPLLRQVVGNRELIRVFAELIVSEIGIGIKGHGLTNYRDRYVGAEQPLSRLHKILNQEEREIVYDVFTKYHTQVYENEQLLDSDDLALTLLSRLRTPLWGLKRKSRGFDFLFVDETQLFNENERRVFPLLTRADSGNLRIALALDEAQEIRGSVSSGFGLLGIESIANEQLRTVYRSTGAILKLAFHLIQRTTDLFGTDFPDFTRDTSTVVPDTDRRAEPPIIAVGGTQHAGIGKFVVKRVEQLRKKLRQVAVVVHGTKYWNEVVTELKRQAAWPVRIVTQRGERLDKAGPLIAVFTPALVGGQEFDAVVAVGLEHGIVPPRVEGNDALAAALEQQALREMYLCFTRARYRLVIVNSVTSSPSPLLKSAIQSKLLIDS